MNTLPLALVATAMFDGILVPATHALYCHTPQHRQLVVAHPSTKQIVSISLPSTLNRAGLTNRVTVEVASLVTVRLISPPTPRPFDFLILVNQTVAGVYQYLDGDWRPFGTTNLTTFSHSSLGQGTSLGLGGKQAFDGLVTLLKRVDKLPLAPEAYTTYYDYTTQILYFPYANAEVIAAPLTLMSLYAPNLMAGLTDRTEFVIFPTGYQQTQTLPKKPGITYNALSQATVGQPLTVYNAAQVVLATGAGIPTGITLNYQMENPSAEALSLGYYQGGNNLWDTFSSYQGGITPAQPTQLLPFCQQKVNMVNLEIGHGVSGNTALVYIYIGAAGAPIQGERLFIKQVVTGKPLKLTDLRLEEGETIFIKAVPALTCSYRITQLARKI